LSALEAKVKQKQAQKAAQKQAAKTNAIKAHHMAQKKDLSGLEEKVRRRFKKAAAKLQKMLQDILNPRMS
jgi:hypothetical protein